MEDVPTAGHEPSAWVVEDDRHSVRLAMKVKFTSLVHRYHTDHIRRGELNVTEHFD